MATPRVIADSSVWIDHINKGDGELASALRRRMIMLHPMVIGEVALGSIRQRELVLSELNALPQATPATHAEVMAMVQWLKLHGCGIGYVDTHLLAATKQIKNCLLWTRDKRLREQAERLGVAYAP
jgi:predicted nucleic acid-binding protein